MVESTTAKVGNSYYQNSKINVYFHRSQLFDAIFVFHKVPLLYVKCRIVSIIAYSKIISGFEIPKMIVFFLKFVNIVERSYCCFPNRQQR